MEDLQFSLIVLGAFAILAVLAHGLWTIRKNNQEAEPDSAIDKDTDDIAAPSIVDVQEPVMSDTASAATFTDEADISQDSALNVEIDPEVAFVDEHSEPDFDEFGISKPKVIDAEPKMPPAMERSIQDANKPMETTSYTPGKPLPSSSTVNTADKQEPSWQDNDMPEVPSSLLRKESEIEPQLEPDPFKVDVDAAVDNTEEKAEATAPPEAKKATLAEQARKLVQRNKTENQKSEKKRREPRVREDQLKMSFDNDPEVSLDAGSKDTKKAEAIQEEVLILNVKTPDDKAINGAALLPMLLTLGFKFGDQDIFHRHVTSNGKGPVLFSLANLFKPGVFDIDNMENFSTLGISLFMILPIEGDPHQVFNMMHNAARKVADEFGGQVLDGRRSLLTKQSLQQYVEKIREFERRRMLQRS